MIAALGGPAALAGEWLTETRVGPDPPRHEVWAGASVGARSWSVYSGTTMAPFGAIASDGWRVRFAGGYGEYHYRARWALSHEPQTFRGTVSFAEALAGYQRRWGAVTIKAFAGLAAEAHNVFPPDPDNDAVGYEVGVKGALETWIDISPRYWTSLDLTWSTVFEAYAARLRAARRIGRDLAVGIEGEALGNVEHDGGRGGLFLRYAWESGELSLAAGSSVDRSLHSGGYATLGALYRY